MDEPQVLERWPPEWMRGVLPLCVLAIVDDGDAHGYAIAARLDEAGLGAVKGGTLYPILARLERDGLVRSTWTAGEGGPGRKVFAITARGGEELRARVARWHRFTRLADGLLPMEREGRR